MKLQIASSLLGVVFFVAAGRASGQEVRNVHLNGSVSDYSPSTVSGGPYEIRGQWSLDVNRSGVASFTADLNMETSDYGITDATHVDPASPGTRSAHHISLTNGTVSYDMSACPTNSPVTTCAGFVVSGTPTNSANGGPAPFEANGPSTLQICVTGGTQVQFANVTLVYNGPAATHFGPQPIHGVVTQVSTR